MRRPRARRAYRTLVALLLFGALVISVLIRPDPPAPSPSSVQTAKKASTIATVQKLPQADAIQVIKPTQGQSVTQRFTIEGKAATYEGMVRWELRYNNLTIDSGRAFSNPGGAFSIAIQAPAQGVFIVALYESKGAQGGYSQLTMRSVIVE